MIKHCFAVFVFFFAGLSLPAQRHGRADAIQNYIRGGPSEPILLLQIQFQEKRSYFRHSDLRKMQRSAVALTDSATGITHTYEGVDLDTLIPATAYGSVPKIIEVSFGSHQTRTISSNDLDPATRPLLADTVDGKQLSGYTPYYFVAKTRQDDSAPIENVKLIAIKMLP